MTSRIWPGALCVIRSSEYRDNLGRIVVAVSLESHDPLAWNIEAQGDPLMVWDAAGGDGYLSRDAVALDECLRPIMPPPGTEATDDRAPCELQPGEIVGV